MLAATCSSAGNRRVLTHAQRTAETRGHVHAVAGTHHKPLVHGIGVGNAVGKFRSLTLLLPHHLLCRLQLAVLALKRAQILLALIDRLLRLLHLRDAPGGSVSAMARCRDKGTGQPASRCAGLKQAGDKPRVCACISRSLKPYTLHPTPYTSSLCLRFALSLS